MSKEHYQLEDSIGYLIFRINQNMHQFFRERLDKEGINVVEAWILLQVLNGKKTITDLKNELKIDMAQVQRACNHLIEKKWMIRLIDPYDKRIKHFSLSTEGIKVIRRVINFSKETNIKALSTLSKDKVGHLRILLMNVLKGPFFNAEE